MVKYTQTIRRLQPTNYFSVFNHFLGLALKGLSIICNQFQTNIPFLSPFLPTVMSYFSLGVISVFFVAFLCIRSSILSRKK